MLHFDRLTQQWVNEVLLRKFIYYIYRKNFIFTCEESDTFVKHVTTAEQPLSNSFSLFCRELISFCRELMVFCRELILFCRELMVYCRELILFYRQITLSCRELSL